MNVDDFDHLTELGQELYLIQAKRASTRKKHYPDGPRYTATIRKITVCRYAYKTRQEAYQHGKKVLSKLKKKHENRI